MALTKASYSMVEGAPINVFDYMTSAEIADVTSNTASLDVQPAVQAAIDAALTDKKILRLPAGTPGTWKTFGAISA